MQNEIEYIKARLDERELLTRLAEEAAELAQAALKLRRALDDNPDTPVTVKEAHWRKIPTFNGIMKRLVITTKKKTVGKFQRDGMSGFAIGTITAV